MMTTDFFDDCACAPANRTLEVDIATASRVGLDGASVAGAAVNPAGELVIEMSDGRTVNAGRVTGTSGLKGIAHLDTLPTVSPDPQLYIAAGRGVYGYFLNRWGAPLQVETDQTIVFFFCPAGEMVWDVWEMPIEINLSEYKKRDEWMALSPEAPAFSCYPPSTEAVPGLYDPATGRFNLPEGANTVTSQTEVFGRIVYTDCTHIMVGFNLSCTIYLEVATGRCLLMDVFTRATHYHNTPFATTGITKKYVRVNTYQASSAIIDIEESDDGIHYVPYASVNRSSWGGLIITYRTIGFYQPGTNQSKILSIGTSDRLALDQVPVWENPDRGVFEVLSPSDNFTGAVRRKIATGGRSFVEKRIMLFGDSITNEFGTTPGAYEDRIRKKFGTSDVLRSGHDGQTLGSATEDRGQSLSNDQHIYEITTAQPDLLILQGGVGDYWSDLPLGEYYGSVENAAYVRTTTGGLRYLLHHLTKNLPVQSKILFVTPPPGVYGGVSDMTPNGVGLRIDEYVKRYRDICAEYHVPVCDAWALGGWSTYNENINPYYTTDGVHLSPQGYERLTDLLIAEASRCC
ncbi:MAG: SGNH/GDSL hydrolase family protein [Rikenellaceae bacterium]|jgi:lysophospholipase L1-like esterase|nr:SGNH/GDSL hydrolase family protein [Rikenellaceae bacterium]